MEGPFLFVRLNPSGFGVSRRVEVEPQNVLENKREEPRGDVVVFDGSSGQDI